MVIALAGQAAAHSLQAIHLHHLFITFLIQSDISLKRAHLGIEAK
jgi:hypothetical protein